MTQSLRLAAALFFIVAAPASADDWPQWMGPNRDGVWRETGVAKKLPEGGPKKVWTVPAGGGYSGPAVVGGKVYLFDYSTDADLRKVNDPGTKSAVSGKERLRCLDAATGQAVWEYSYDCPYKVSYASGPRCTPTVHAGKVYALGTMGDLACLDLDSGAVVWKTNFVEKYKAPVQQWGFSGHPLVDGDKLICIVGGEGSAAVAFDKNTGKELWRSLSSKDAGYAPPALVEAGGTRQLIIWTAQTINSLNPENGSVYWSEKLEPNYGMSIMAPQLDGDLLFAGGIGKVAACFRLAKDRPAAEVVWRADRDTALFPANSTPLLENGVMYGQDCMTGALIAAEIKTGKRLWETFAPAAGKRAPHGTVFAVKNGDLHYLFNEKGELIVAKLSPQKYEEISRAKVLEPTGTTFGRDVVWSHPAFAGRHMFARNDKELVCVSLAE